MHETIAKKALAELEQAVAPQALAKVNVDFRNFEERSIALTGFGDSAPPPPPAVK